MGDRRESRGIRDKEKRRADINVLRRLGARQHAAGPSRMINIVGVNAGE